MSNIVRLDEVSRNELLAKSKGETITRYNKSAGYKGFSILNIDTTNVLTNNSLVVTCRVGDYADSIELEDLLYWVQIVAENTNSYTKNQINTKVVTQALMNAIDGMDIKVDCECGDWRYRMAYQATEWGYKYGKPENRPANIRNPQGYGALCKHLIALLSNKRWLQQVTSKLMDWLEQNIDAVNKFLNVKEGQELTLPNELARQNAKDSWKNRRSNQNDQPEESVDDEEVDQDNVENNDQDNSNIPATGDRDNNSGIDELDNNEEEK